MDNIKKKTISCEEIEKMINSSLYKTLHGVPDSISFELLCGNNDIVHLFVYYNDKGHAQQFIIRGVNSITAKITEKIYNTKYKK